MKSPQRWTAEEIAMLAAGKRRIPGRDHKSAIRKAYMLGLSRKCGFRECRKCTTRAPLDKYTHDISRGKHPRCCDDCYTGIAAYRESLRVAAANAAPKRPRVLWTQDEIAMLKSGRRDIPGRTDKAVKCKAISLGLPHAVDPRHLDDAYKTRALHLARKGARYSLIAARLGTTKNAVAGIVNRNREKLYALHG
jgi:hypothetical protein